MRIYFAYGSNLSKAQMKRRAPSAQPLCKVQVRDWTLIFRHVADITPSPGGFVNGALYLIDDEAEAALDDYEGVASGTYRKVLLPINLAVGGVEYREMLTYVMNSEGIMPPSAAYLSRIKDGYHDWGLPIGPLSAAVEKAHDDRAPSHHERRRHRRAGKPPLAMRPSKKSALVSAAMKAGQEIKRPKVMDRKLLQPKRRTPTPAPEAGKGQLDLALWRKAMTIYGD